MLLGSPLTMLFSAATSALNFFAAPKLALQFAELSSTISTLGRDVDSDGLVLKISVSSAMTWCCDHARAATAPITNFAKRFMRLSTGRSGAGARVHPDLDALAHRHGRSGDGIGRARLQVP